MSIIYTNTVPALHYSQYRTYKFFRVAMFKMITSRIFVFIHARIIYIRTNFSYLSRLLRMFLAAGKQLNTVQEKMPHQVLCMLRSFIGIHYFRTFIKWVHCRFLFRILHVPCVMYVTYVNKLKLQMCGRLVTFAY
jgi:hypothetical protein